MTVEKDGRTVEYFDCQRSIHVQIVLLRQDTIFERLKMRSKALHAGVQP